VADYTQQLLNRQLGVIHFALLRPLFLSIDHSSIYHSTAISFVYLTQYGRFFALTSAAYRHADFAARARNSPKATALSEAQTIFCSVLVCSPKHILCHINGNCICLWWRRKSLIIHVHRPPITSTYISCTTNAIEVEDRALKERAADVSVVNL